ncbi:MAG: hypothetical protein AAGC86_13720 [Pseudomonadota bacterium]
MERRQEDFAKAKEAAETASKQGLIANSAAAGSVDGLLSEAAGVERAAVWTEVQRDCSVALSKESVWAHRLWRGRGELAQAWALTKSAWDNAGPPWNAFAEIYHSFWMGRDPGWSRVEQIVLIAPEVWEAGPEAIAQEIARIEEQMRLLEEIEALRARVKELTSFVPADAAARSNNLPEDMEPLDAPAEVAQQMVQLLAALDKAQHALVKPKPDRSELERAATSLLTVRNGLLAIGAAACIGFWERAGGWLFEELILNGRLEALARQIQVFAGGL